MEESVINNSDDLNDKIQTIELNLKQISNKCDELNEMVIISELGDTQRLVLSKEKIEIEKIFSQIESNLFDYEKRIHLNGHSGDICCLENVDRNRILTGSIDKTIKLWDLKEAKCLRQY